MADIARACATPAIAGRAWHVGACFLSRQVAPRTSTCEIRQESPCFFKTKTLLLLLHNLRMGRKLLERVQLVGIGFSSGIHGLLLLLLLL